MAKEQAKKSIMKPPGQGMRPPGHGMKPGGPMKPGKRVKKAVKER